MSGALGPAQTGGAPAPSCAAQPRADGSGAEQVATGERLSFPAWSSDGTLACLAYADDHQYLRLPCDSEEPLFIAKAEDWHHRK